MASHGPLVQKGLASASDAKLYLQLPNPGTEVEYLQADPAGHAADRVDRQRRDGRAPS